VISFVAETNVLTLSACRRFGVPILVAERIDPAQHSIGRLRHRLRRALYPRAHAVVVQTEAARVWIHERIPGARARIIPNPAIAPHDDSREPQWRPQGGRWVVGMGRLTRQKGFDLLLRAFARCCRARPEWSLAILGEGEERSRLEALAGELGVAPRVMLPGAVPRPAEILRRADLFVLSSRFEGFPNALLEAMACGVASIAADCPSGPAEILDSGRDGVLVPAEDTDALTEAMERLMGDEAQRRALGVRATGVTQRFSLERVAGMWEALLAEASLRPASRSLLA
jgi:glycosyltransferase involved in cell wall biosynthesis